MENLVELNTGRDTISPQEQLLNMVSNYTFIDIGQILQCNTKHKADIGIFRYRNNMQIVYRDVEILSIPGFKPDYTNAIGLLFIPKTVMPDTIGRQTIPNATYYSAAGAKFVPLSNNIDSTTKISTTQGGDVCIGSYYNNITFSDHQVAVVQLDDDGNFLTNLLFNADGSSSLYFFNELRRIDVATDGTITISLYNSGGYLIYEEIKNISGVIIKTYYDGSSNEKVLRCYTSNPDGSFNNKIYNGDVSALTSIEVSEEGAIDINANGTTISIDTDGAVSIESAGDITIKAGTNGDKTISITCQEFNVNNGNLKVE